MRWRTLVIAASLLLVGVAVVLCWPVDRGPHDHPFPPIAHEYHVCDKCGSLDGGISGKGPHKRLRSESGRWCVHRWLPVSRAEFKQQASDRFGVDWSREIPFWSGEPVGGD